MGTVVQLFPKKPTVYNVLTRRECADELADNAFDCMMLSLEDDGANLREMAATGDLTLINCLIRGMSERSHGITSDYTSLLDRLKQEIPQ